MKTKLTIIFITALAIYSSSAFAATIHVPGDQPTIQDGIDAANDGDTVVVMEGRYTGPGNRNLNFHGKRITVRSQDPENNKGIRATIIDAEGQGVIVRLVSDEGPESVFEGFTLIVGDTSKPVRGLPGFFEFSLKARPTTRRLRVERSNFIQTESGSIEAAEPPYGGRFWDGNNPFHQTVATTDYYGSGDVDADGSLTEADVSFAQEIANGIVEPSTRADVDGNGVVNASDVALISSALTGGILPGWWNQLSDRSERHHWVSQILALDPTDKHPYTYWFQCYAFATQTFIHSNSYRFDLFSTRYDGGQTLFNVPMYRVSVDADGFGHAINAILVGDDPLNFDDWRFLEPQMDYNVSPGMWDMPYGSMVEILTLCPAPLIGQTGPCSDFVKVEFQVDETGWTLIRHSPDLETTPTLPSNVEPDNRPDLWNPRVVPVNTGLILFDRAREDMSRMTDIHMAAFPFEGEMSAIPITQSSQYSRLLDVVIGPSGGVHLLWTGKEPYSPGVFYGELNTVTGELNKVARISDGTRVVREGRVVAASNGEIHAFWLETAIYSSHPHSSGIYWAHRTDSAWVDEVNLTADWPSGSMPAYRDHPEIDRYHFDVAVLENDAVLLLWNNTGNPKGVYQRYYDGTWADATLVANSAPLDILGVEVEVDSHGDLHLAYWWGYKYDYSSFPYEPDCLGNLEHKVFHDGYWSETNDVDLSGLAGYPSFIRTPRGSVSLVWVRKVGSQMVPIWSQYVQGVWQPSTPLNISSGTDAWYPTGDLLPDGRILIAWSSRSPDIVTIETYEYFPAPWAGFSGGPISGEAPLTVSFSDESVGKVDTWGWQFGDGTGSVDINPNHAYQDPGHYTVSLTVSGPGGSDTETKTDYITVTYPAPVANFTANPISGVHPLTVNFTDQSTGEITSRSWDFDDGSTSNDKNPTHTYNDPGTYTVNLTVNGPGGTDTETKTDYIVVDYLTPIVNFTADPTNGVAPLTVSFTDESTGDITNWLWDFGDSEDSTAKNPKHTYQFPGTYTLSLTVTGPGGMDTETKTDYITVAHPPSIAKFSADVISGVHPLTVNFTDESTGEITSRSWAFGDDSTSTKKNPSHTYDDPGTYTVSLTCTGPGGSDTETKNDYIVIDYIAPIANFVADFTEGMIPFAVSFTDKSTGDITNWLWDFGDTESSTDQKPTHIYTEEGLYTVTLSVSGPEGLDTEIKTDYIAAYEELTLTDPNGGEIITSGSYYTIEWVAPFIADNFRLKLSMDKGKTWEKIDKGIADTSYDWDVPTPKQNKTKCLVKVQAFESNGDKIGVDQSDGPFTIEVLTITSPQEREPLTSGSLYTIEWNTNETRKPVDKVYLKYSKNGGTTWNPIAKIVGDNPGEYLWTVPDVNKTKNEGMIRVVLKNANNKIVAKAVSDGFFTIEP